MWITLKNGRSRRLQQTTVSCKRFYCNKPQKILKVDKCEVLWKDGTQRVSPFYHVASYMSSVVDFFPYLLWAPPGIVPLPPAGERTRWWVPLLAFPEWNWPELSFSRFLVKTAYVVNAPLKSERSLNGPIFSKFIERDPPILSVSKVLFLRHSIGEIFLRILVHLDTDPFSSIMFELRFRTYGIFQETMVNPFKIPLYVSLSQFMGIWWSLCSLVFPNRWPWCHPFFRT